MNELFAIPESRSPRLIWMERHGITIQHNPHLELDPYIAIHNGSIVGCGSSDEWACWSAAKKMEIPTWHKL